MLGVAVGLLLALAATHPVGDPPAVVPPRLAPAAWTGDPRSDAGVPETSAEPTPAVEPAGPARPAPPSSPAPPVTDAGSGPQLERTPEPPGPEPPVAELPPVVADPVPAAPGPPTAVPVARPPVPPSLPDPRRGGYRLMLPSLPTGMVVRPSTNFGGPGLAAARDAVAELNAIVPARWTVGPVGSGVPGPNEVAISYGKAAAVCPGQHAGGTVYGCTGAIGDLLETRRVFIVIDPAATASPALLRHHVFHELGHAAGLDHYDRLVDGQPQVMASSAVPATAAVHFGAGDRNGLAALSRNDLQRLFLGAVSG